MGTGRSSGTAGRNAADDGSPHAAEDDAAGRPPLGASLLSRPETGDPSAAVGATPPLDFAATQQGAEDGDAAPGLAGVGTPKDAGVAFGSTRVSLSGTVASESADSGTDASPRPSVAIGSSPSPEDGLGSAGAPGAIKRPTPPRVRVSLVRHAQSSLPRTPVLPTNVQGRAATVVSSEEGTGSAGPRSATSGRGLPRRGPSELPGFFDHFREGASAGGSPRPSGVSEGADASRRGSAVSRDLGLPEEEGVEEGARLDGTKGPGSEASSTDGGGRNHHLGSTMDSVRPDSVDGSHEQGEHAGKGVDGDQEGPSAGLTQANMGVSRSSIATGDSSPAQTHIAIPGEALPQRSPRTVQRIRRLQAEAVLTQGGAKELPSDEAMLEAELRRIRTANSETMQRDPVDEKEDED